MKVVKKPVKVIAVFDTEGNIKPYKFSIIDEDGIERKFKIYKVGPTETVNFKGDKVRKITCTVAINGQLKLCELQYDVDTTKWILYKI